MRKQSAGIMNEFVRNLDITMFLRKRPKFFPRVLWNLMINWLIMKK